jgi:hypothetical protein
MRSSMKWIDTLLLVAVCAALAAGVAFYVARKTGPADSGPDVTAPMPPVALSDRQTVALSAATIVPVVSADASVVQDGDDWLLVAPAPSADVAYRLLDPPVAVKAQIDGGPTGFACDWAGLGQAGAGASQGVMSSSQLEPNALNVTMRCRIPDDVRVVAGLTGIMVLQMGKPTNVQALPLTAVLGSVDNGQVVVVHADGTTELRQVKLGVSDNYNIQVVAGLQPDERVLVYPTQSDFSQARSDTP